MYPPAMATLEELEPTLHAAEEAEVAPLDDLERTAVAEADAARATPPPEAPPEWLEDTHHPPAPVTVATLPDVEPTAHGAAPSAPRDPFALPVCRYCRTPAAPGDSFCERCGVKLDIYHPGGGAAPSR